jgi:ligand-binding sensor domain-containing protein
MHTSSINLQFSGVLYSLPDLRKTLYITILSFFSTALFSQSSNFLFHNTKVKEGLSFNYCYTLFRDSRGIMWIGTLNGLNRYDGAHFTHFYAGQDSSSFINSTIMDLCEDKQGNIWGATASGIFRYDVLTNKFTNYIPPGYDYARAVQNILCDKQGNIWATGLWTILKLNRQKNRFEEIGPLTTRKDSLGAYSVRQNGMVEDPSGKGIWMTTRSGLYFYNIKENKFYNHQNVPGDSVFTDHNVAALSLSRFGHFWLFDNITKDVIAFDPDTRKVLHRISMKGIMDNAAGQTLFEDSNHMLWFSTWNLRMVTIDYRQHRITPLVNNIDNPLSIPGESFWAIWEDEDQTVWIGTGGGLARCNYSKNLYNVYPVADRVKEFSKARLETFSIDPRDNSWWISSENERSIIHYYPENGNYIFFDFKKAGKNSSGQLVGGVYDINFVDGQPFAATTTGVWRLDEKNRAIVPYERTFKETGADPFIYFKEEGKYYWYFTSRGFIRINKISGEEKLIRSSIETLPDSQKVHHNNIFTDRKGRAWFVPAFGWLGYIDEKDEVILKYYVRDKPRELSGFLISMKQDSKGLLWMASSEAGLYRYDIEKEDLKLLNQAQGIGSQLRDMIIDKEDRIWMVSYNQFSIYEPSTGSSSVYHLPLHENTVNYHNGFRLDKDGAVLATLNRDIVKFMPDRLKLKPGIKAPLISSIKIAGKEKLINNETAFYLQPSENSLEFSFGSLINNEIFPYTFEYRLDGFDKNWIQAGTSAKALYSNLDPGEYTFRVKAISKNKNWETPERTMTITIKTPFYKALWFWLLIGSVLIGSLIFFYRFRLNKQKQILTLETKAQHLEKEKTVVMYDSLKQQLNPHFLFNSLTSLSGLIETNQEMAGEFLEQMSGIYRYILKNGDNETVALKDELGFVKLYTDLQQTRFKKGLEVNIDVPEEYLHFKIAPVTLQNLIENAIKHNIIDAGSPLVIDIFIEEDHLVVKNNLQLKSSVETSNKKGLAQFVTLYSYLSTRPVQIIETKKDFLVKIPLV